MKDYVGLIFKMHCNTCFGAYLKPAGSLHGNLQVVCGNEQDDLFYSAGPHRNLH